MSAQKIKVSVVGASGYGGGEAVRLLLNHPNVELFQVTSESNAGKFIHTVHPNLRKRTDLKFVPMSALEPTDLLILALPHGVGAAKMGKFATIAPRIIDLSSDFRLRNAADYPQWYEHAHEAPHWLGKFVYGVPELHRAQLPEANYVAGAGCFATATILGLMPLFKHGLADTSGVIVEGKVGSSAAGNKPSLASHHPERSGALRSYEPTGHRHTAEVTQELNYGQAPKVHLSATSTDAVRGILATAHVFLKEDLQEKDIWKVFRLEYDNEPFIRLVKTKDGIYRYPEPKIVMGTNFCDIGFEKDPYSNRLVVISAIDNLMKGTSGNAIQAMNIMYGWEETTALEFTGLHPV